MYALTKYVPFDLSRGGERSQEVPGGYREVKVALIPAIDGEVACDALLALTFLYDKPDGSGSIERCSFVVFADTVIPVGSENLELVGSVYGKGRRGLTVYHVFQEPPNGVTRAREATRAYQDMFAVVNGVMPTFIPPPPPLNLQPIPEVPRFNEVDGFQSFYISVDTNTPDGVPQTFLILVHARKLVDAFIAAEQCWKDRGYEVLATWQVHMTEANYRGPYLLDADPMVAQPIDANEAKRQKQADDYYASNATLAKGAGFREDARALKVLLSMFLYGKVTPVAPVGMRLETLGLINGPGVTAGLTPKGLALVCEVVKAVELPKAEPKKAAEPEYLVDAQRFLALFAIYLGDSGVPVQDHVLHEMKSLHLIENDASQLCGWKLCDRGHGMVARLKNVPLPDSYSLPASQNLLGNGYEQGPPGGCDPILVPDTVPDKWHRIWRDDKRIETWPKQGVEVWCSRGPGGIPFRALRMGDWSFFDGLKCYSSDRILYWRPIMMQQLVPEAPNPGNIA